MAELLAEAESQWSRVKSQLLGNSRNGITLKGDLRNLVIIKTSVDLLIGANCLKALEPVEVMPRQMMEHMLSEQQWVGVWLV